MIKGKMTDTSGQLRKNQIKRLKLKSFLTQKQVLFNETFHVK
jgi:hypothetical protein